MVAMRRPFAECAGGTGRVCCLGGRCEFMCSCNKISDEARQFSRIQSELRDALNRVIRWITVGLAVIIPVVSWGQIQAAAGGRTVQQNHHQGAGFYCCGVFGCFDDSAGSGSR